MGLIYLDTCLVIYVHEGHATWGPPTYNAIAREAPERFAISPLTKMECLVKPIRSTNLILQRHYEASFDAYHILSMSEEVFLLAAHLRARFSLKTPDALHLACAQYHRCDALWTNDDRLAQAGHGLASSILK